MALPGSGQSTPAIKAPRPQNQWAQTVPQTQQLRAQQQKANPAAFAPPAKPGIGTMLANDAMDYSGLSWAKRKLVGAKNWVTGTPTYTTKEDYAPRPSLVRHTGDKFDEWVSGKPKPVAQPPAGPAELAQNPNLKYQAKLEHFTTLPEETLRKFRRGDALSPAEDGLIRREMLGHNPSLADASQEAFAQEARQHADGILNHYDTARRAWAQPEAGGLTSDPVAIPGMSEYASSLGVQATDPKFLQWWKEQGGIGGKGGFNTDNPYSRVRRYVAAQRATVDAARPTGPSMTQYAKGIAGDVVDRGSKAITGGLHAVGGSIGDVAGLVPRLHASAADMVLGGDKYTSMVDAGRESYRKAYEAGSQDFIDAFKFKGNEQGTPDAAGGAVPAATSNVDKYWQKADQSLDQAGMGGAPKTLMHGMRNIGEGAAKAIPMVMGGGALGVAAKGLPMGLSHAARLGGWLMKGHGFGTAAEAPMQALNAATGDSFAGAADSIRKNWVDDPTAGPLKRMAGTVAASGIENAPWLAATAVTKGRAGLPRTLATWGMGIPTAMQGYQEATGKATPAAAEAMAGRIAGLPEAEQGAAINKLSPEQQAALGIADPAQPAAAAPAVPQAPWTPQHDTNLGTLRQVELTKDGISKLSPEAAAAMHQQATEVEKNFAQLPENQKSDAAELVTRSKALQHVQATGQDMTQVIEKAKSGGWDANDMQSAISNFAKEHPQAAESPGFMQQLVDIFGRMEPGQQMAAVIGIPLAIGGFLAAMGGSGGLLAPLIGMLGTVLGAGAFAGGQPAAGTPPGATAAPGTPPGPAAPGTPAPPGAAPTPPGTPPAAAGTTAAVKTPMGFSVPGNSPLAGLLSDGLQQPEVSQLLSNLEMRNSAFALPDPDLTALMREGVKVDPGGFGKQVADMKPTANSKGNVLGVLTTPAGKKYYGHPGMGLSPTEAQRLYALAQGL